jgi:prevent-host-death family protein
MTATIWSIPEAKARLSEILRRARAGENQVIGAKDPCVVLAKSKYDDLRRKAGKVHLGRWLVQHAPKVDFDPPERTSGRPNAFED